MLSASTVLAGLPSQLRGELLSTYEAIAQNYMEGRWAPSELDGGKFCEVAYCILLGAVTSSMPNRASKPANMVSACRDLEKFPAKAGVIGDRSFRILIPRVLLAIYEIRNNRNVGHVGGDVDPNFLDATAVYGMASWVLAELVRIFHNLPIQEAQTVVDALVERKSRLIWLIGNTRRVLDPSLSVKDQTLLLLHSKPGWVSDQELIGWTEYSNSSKFRSDILGQLHKARLIEFDRAQNRVHLSPVGIQDVETRILKLAIT
jgi:hypothetical protein